MEIKRDNDELVPEEKDPYRKQRGLLREITSKGGRSYIGVYQGLTSNDLLLRPCVVGENYPNGEKNERTHFLNWVDDEQYIDLQSVESIGPVSEDYLRFRLSENKPILILP